MPAIFDSGNLVDVYARDGSQLFLRPASLVTQFPDTEAKSELVFFTNLVFVVPIVHADKLRLPDGYSITKFVDKMTRICRRCAERADDPEKSCLSAIQGDLQSIFVFAAIRHSEFHLNGVKKNLYRSTCFLNLLPLLIQTVVP